MLSAAFAKEERARALGIFSGVTGFALIVGPAIGGFICQTLGWRWVFWINLPIGMVAIALTFARLRESFGPRAALDIPGLTTVAGAALAIMWGLLRGNISGWTSGEVLGAFVAGVFFAAVFVNRELRAHAPMVPMRLFGAPAFSAGVAASFLFYAAMYGVLFLLPQFLQTVLGFGPLVATGLLMQTIGLGWIATIAAPGIGYSALVAPLVLAGTGVSMAMPAAQNAILSSVAMTEMGKASGIFNMARFLGGMFGIAVMVAAFSASGAAHSVAGFGRGFTSAITVAAALSLLGAFAGLALPARHRLASAPKPQNV
jgi:Major Facilitator Superfamily